MNANSINTNRANAMAAKLKLIVGCIIVVLILGACSQPPAEQAIRKNIEAIELAIEEKSSRAVLTHLSEYFSINNKIDKKSTRGMLAGYFLRHKRIGIIISNIDITVNEADPMRAVSTATVALVGAQNFVPDSGRLYQVEAQWQVESSDWHLMSLNWK